MNGVRVVKTSHGVGAGDVLTFAQGRLIRVVRIVALGTRRGPAAEAQGLYADMTPEAEPVPDRVGPRPTKKDRRDMDTFRDTD